MKTTLQIFWEQWDWQDQGKIFAVSCDTPDLYISPDRIYIKTVEVDIDAVEPDRAQVALAKVDALKKDRANLQAETQLKINMIDDRIKQLSCIEYKEATL